MTVRKHVEFVQTKECGIAIASDNCSNNLRPYAAGLVLRLNNTLRYHLSNRRLHRIFSVAGNGDERALVEPLLRIILLLDLQNFPIIHTKNLDASALEHSGGKMMYVLRCGR